MNKVRNAALALAGAAALTLPSIGMAQSMSGPDSAWYIGGSVGQSKFDVDCSGATCDDTDTAFRVFGGYMFNKHFGVELGYADLGKLTITGALPPFGTVSASLKVKAFDLVAVGVLPIGDKFSVYGKLGMYRADSDLSASSTTGLSGSTSDNNTDITGAIGAGYNFTKNLGIRAEYQRYSKVGSDNSGGEGDIDVFSIGVVWHFK
jgi:OmpA-OmpF porin, OOP family